MGRRRHVARLLARAQQRFRLLGFSLVRWARLRQEGSGAPGELRSRAQVLLKLDPRLSMTQGNLYVPLRTRGGLTALEWAQRHAK